MASAAIELPERTILVAGTGRSGTTWLGKILDASSRVDYKHEPDNVGRLPWFRDIPSRIDPGDGSASFRGPFAAAVAQSFDHHASHFHRPPHSPKAFRRSWAWSLLDGSVRVARALGRGDSPRRIPAWVRRSDAEPVFRVVKSVSSNMRLAWLHECFPELRSVLIVRHPGGYLNSWRAGVRKQGWSGLGSKERLAAAILPFSDESHARRYGERFESGTDAERELIYWIVANETPARALRDCERCLLVVYEDLCRAPLEVARRIYAHSEVPFCERAEAFVRSSTSEHRQGYHDVHKDPLVVAEKWRRELSEEDRELVERYLATSELASLWT